uniref:Uncharacterized protein n=1 Tax=viral metagenome TaxID=1070528 RepID=A0A6M3KFS8_9ZZZZ
MKNAIKEGIGTHYSKGIAIGVGGIQFEATSRKPEDEELQPGRMYYDLSKGFQKWDGKKWGEFFEGGYLG